VIRATVEVDGGTIVQKALESLDELLAADLEKDGEPTVECDGGSALESPV
jgi:hypothetical protein